MSGDRNWRRRQAIQLVAQLPESIDDALEVLELAKELVKGFLSEDQPPVPLTETAGVLAFRPRRSPSEA